MMPSTMIWVAINSPRYPCNARNDASIVYATDDTGSAMTANANATNSTTFIRAPTGPDTAGPAFPGTAVRDGCSVQVRSSVVGQPGPSPGRVTANPDPARWPRGAAPGRTTASMSPLWAGCTQRTPRR
jgi:hypothetical protein